MSGCKIYLENYNGTYCPGDEIKGRVELDLTNPTTVRSIKIKLLCNEHTSWTRTEHYQDSENREQTREVHYSGNNEVLHINYKLFTSVSGSERLSGGKHVYPFTVDLPQDIPPIFCDSVGYISYEIQGIVDIPMASDYKDRCIFVVHAPIDFNKMERWIQEPATFSEEKTLCCSWWCQGGAITMDLELPKRAFVPEEDINFKVSISNMSNSNVEGLDVMFTRTITYKANSPFYDFKESAIYLAKIQEHGVGAHGQHTYNLKFNISKYIFIPNFVRCSLLTVDYFFKATCRLPTCTLNLDIIIDDLMVGHVKWGEEDNSRIARTRRLPQIGNVNSSEFVSNPTGIPPSAPPPENTEPSAPSNKDLPPSYSEAMQMTANS